MNRTALRLVEASPFIEEMEFLSESSIKKVHALHHLISWQGALRPDIANYFISRYTKPGQGVLDPFCRGGVTVLEAALLKRQVYAADTDALSVLAARAKLAPVSLPEVTLWLQTVNLRRPVSTETFHSNFSAFYDLNTYRELVNIRSALKSDPSQTARFVELIVLGLLHGHQNNYLSSYTSPYVSVSSKEQETINDQRGQNPVHRTVVPRVIRKVASCVLEGIDLYIKPSEAKHLIARCDPRDLKHVPNQSIDLTITAPPALEDIDYNTAHWLRHWFVGKEQANQLNFSDISTWTEFMNEVLFEMARVTRTGGRVILALPSGDYKEALAHTVTSALVSFWCLEGTITHPDNKVRIGQGYVVKRTSLADTRDHYLILRRR